MASGGWTHWAHDHANDDDDNDDFIWYQYQNSDLTILNRVRKRPIKRWCSKQCSFWQWHSRNRTSSSGSAATATFSSGWLLQLYRMSLSGEEPSSRRLEVELYLFNALVEQAASPIAFPHVAAAVYNVALPRSDVVQRLKDCWDQRRWTNSHSRRCKMS